MQKYLGVYNPADVVISVGGIVIEGVDEGSFIEIEREKPEEFMAKVGARGDVTFVKNLNRAGKIRLNLKQNAARDHAYLASLAESDAIFDVQIVRAGGGYRELVSAQQCVIGQRPRNNFADDEQQRQWDILAAKIVEINKEE